MTVLFSIHETSDRNGLRTAGLRAKRFSDLLLRHVPLELRDAAREMLQTLARYQIDSDVRINSNERVRHGYWVIETRTADDQALEIWESTPDGGAFVPGADLTLRYWLDQHRVCDKAGAAFEPPLPDQMVAVSAGVLEGRLPLNGVRYPEPGHMSGWFLTTDLYSGNAKDLKVDHLYHLTAARPELAQYLALPPGFRFKVEQSRDDVFFDQTVLQE